MIKINLKIVTIWQAQTVFKVTSATMVIPQRILIATMSQQ
jgi:hypothetical protein